MLTVLMATCNGAATLPKTLGAFTRLAAPRGRWSLLVVDDGSTDATAAVLAEFAQRLPLRFVRQDRSGKNAALNLALQLALDHDPADLFLFTDDDVSPEPDWLQRMEECAAAHPAYSLFGGAIHADWCEMPPDWVLRQVPLGLTYGVTVAEEGPVFPGLVWGANMAVRRAVFETGYRFDIALGPNAGSYAMGSETEFNRRLGAAGYSAWFCARARVGHFIRSHQMRAPYILARAYRFGRGAQIQETPDDARRLFGAPRWMLARLAREWAGVVRAWFSRDPKALFAHRWESAYLRGFLFQAWLGGGRQLTRAMRVLITSCSGQLGGMEWRMAEEARLLIDAGCHASVATPRFAGHAALAARLKATGAGVTIFDPPQFAEQWRWRRLRQLRARLFAGRQLRRLRPDLVHVAFCWTSYGASLLWLSSHCKLPAVISIHNAFLPEPLTPWHTRLYRQAFRTVRGAYAVSPSAMAHFMRVYGDFLPTDARLCVIPNGVDCARFQPSAARRASRRAALGLATDTLVIGAVGRLDAQKRPDAVIDVFCALRNRHPGLRLILIGSGPLDAVLRDKVTQLGLTPAVLFAGQVDAVEEWLPALDLHLLLSRAEGFGIATIEAMACGVPVVGTDVPGTADILRGCDAGMLVPLHDQGATVERIGALLADPDRRAAMGRIGRAEVLHHYTAELMAARLRAFYAGLAP
ncbi:MAG: glycosyltransferase [Massilia sp.]